MAKERITDKFESLPKAVKFLLFLFPITGYVISSVYRFCRYDETRETTTLIYGVVGLVSGLSIIFGWADALSELKNNKVTFFAE